MSGIPIFFEASSCNYEVGLYCKTMFVWAIAKRCMHIYIYIFITVRVSIESRIKDLSFHLDTFTVTTINFLPLTYLFRQLDTVEKMLFTLVKRPLI